MGPFPFLRRTGGVPNMNRGSLQIRARLRGRRRTGGFTLVEMMIALGLLFVGLLGMVGMASEAVKQNQANADMTYTAMALQDRLSAYHWLPRQYLQDKGVNTAFECDVDTEPNGYDIAANIGYFEEDLDKFGTDDMPEGQIGYPFILRMTWSGICTPDRKSEQGLTRCEPDPTGKAFRGGCAPGERQVGGMERNARTSNTYQVDYELENKVNGYLSRGQFWVADDPSRMDVSS